MTKTLLTLAMILTIPLPVFSLPIEVYFDHEIIFADIEEQFTVSLMANIPEETKVTGWGLDILHDERLEKVMPPIVGKMWRKTWTQDNDDLAGLSFNPIWGDEILLATVTFKLLGIGSTEILAGYTYGSKDEGFSLSYPQYPIGSFAEQVKFRSVKVNPVPEPGTIILLALGITGITGINKKIRKI